MHQTGSPLNKVTLLALASRVHCQVFANEDRNTSLVKRRVDLMDKEERGFSLICNFVLETVNKIIIPDPYCHVI